MKKGGIQIIAKQLDKKVRLKDIEIEFKSKFNASLDGSYYYSPKQGQYIFYYKFNTIVFIGLTKEQVEFRVGNISGKNSVLETLTQEFTLIEDISLEQQFQLSSDYVKVKEISLNCTN